MEYRTKVYIGAGTIATLAGTGTIALTQSADYIGYAPTLGLVTLVGLSVLGINAIAQAQDRERENKNNLDDMRILEK